MRIAAIAAAAFLGLVAAVEVTAAQPPKRTTVTGTIKVLKLTKTITVRGKRSLTCRITHASPRAVTLRGFTLGTTARITCAKGVLLAIVHPGATSITPSGTVTVPKTEPEPGPAVTTPGTGGVKTAPSIAGNGTVTLLTSGLIEFNNSISCVLGSNSPSVSAYRVGSRVSYTCTGGELQTIGAGEGV